MSSRPMLAPFPVIVNGNMASAITSKVTVIQNVSMVSYTCVWSGASPSGAITVQASNDYSQNVDGSVKNAGNWVTLPLSTTATVSGTADSGVIDIDATALYALRLIYTPVSGTGTLNVTINGKVA